MADLVTIPREDFKEILEAAQESVQDYTDANGEDGWSKHMVDLFSRYS